MEKHILKGKREQVFFSFFLPQIMLGFIPNFDSNVALIKTILISLTYLVWIFMLGRALNACIPRRSRLNETPQKIFLFVFVVIFVPIIMFADIGIGFYGLGILIPILILFSIIYLFYFASKALTSAERGKRTSFRDHASEMFQLLFGWIGIWFIQPRINELYKKNKHLFEDE